MSDHSFSKLPRGRFFLKAGILLVPTYFLALLALGIYLIESEGKPGSSAMAVARDYQERTLNFYRRMPEACLSGNTVNDFQKRQCDEYWSQLAVDSAVSLSPAIVALLIYVLLLDNLRLIYRRADKRIADGKALSTASVTHPPKLKKDFFAWLYCLEAYSVQMPGGEQIRVHLPEGGLGLKPADTVAVFEGGKLLGRKRYFAIPYNPHVVIIRGAAD